MRKIIERSYLCLLFVFFALFALLIRIDATDHRTIYALGLIIGSNFLTVIPFFTNNCKKIEARRMYLITMILISIGFSLNGIDYLLVDIIGTSDILLSIRLWIVRIVQIIFLTSIVITLYFSIKDLFKKGYSIQKFDLQAIQMVVNLLTYAAFYYVLFDLGEPKMTLVMDGFQGGKNYFIVDFLNYDTIRNAILIIIGIYVAVYVLIEVLKYHFFEKIKDTSTRDFN